MTRRLFLSETEYMVGAHLRVGSALHRVVRCDRRPHETAYSVIIEPVLHKGVPITNRKQRRAYVADRKRGK